MRTHKAAATNTVGTNHKKPLAYDSRSEVVRVVHAPIVTGLSSATVWRRRRDDPDFPKAIRLGDNSAGFIRRELETWRESKKVG